MQLEGISGVLLEMLGQSCSLFFLLHMNKGGICVLVLLTAAKEASLKGDSKNTKINKVFWDFIELQDQASPKGTQEFSGTKLSLFKPVGVDCKGNKNMIH